MMDNRFSKYVLSRRGLALGGILLASPLISSHQAAAEQQALEALTDEELLERLSEPEARTLLEARFSTYPDAKKRRIMQEHHDAVSARPQTSREEPTPTELLEQIAAVRSIDDLAGLLAKLETSYKEADEMDKHAIQMKFFADWDRAPLPDSSQDSGAFGSLDLYFVYANNAKKYVQSESELLDALSSRLLRPEISNGEYRVLEALAQPGLSDRPSILGPLAASHVENVLSSLNARKKTPEFLEILPDLVGFSHTILAGCGGDGLKVLKKLDSIDTEQGINTLRHIDDPEAESILWEVYGNFPVTSRSMRVQVLGALMEKERRNPDPNRLRHIREELVSHLKIPDESFYLAELRAAAGVAGETRDVYYLSHLRKLQVELQDTDLSGALENLNYPEGFQHNVDGLKLAIADAIKALERVKSKE